MNTRFLALPLIISSLIACGGRVDSTLIGSSGASGGSSGNSSGGNSSGGTSSGSSGVTCEAYPACDPGDTFIADVTCGDGACPDVACSSEFATCYTREICGSQIVCGKPPQCRGFPTCDAGFRPIGDPRECVQDAPCFSKSFCGNTIWCTAEDDVQCAAVPSCPLDWSQLSGPNDPFCTQSGATCRSESMCGVTIWCGWDYRATPTPPPPQP